MKAYRCPFDAPYASGSTNDTADFAIAKSALPVMIVAAQSLLLPVLGSTSGAVTVTIAQLLALVPCGKLELNGFVVVRMYHWPEINLIGCGIELANVIQV